MRLIHSEEVQLGHGKGCWGVDVQIKGANDENGKACEDHIVPTLMEQLRIKRFAISNLLSC